MTRSFSKPEGPRCFARNTSPIPPEASLRRRTYFPNVERLACATARLSSSQPNPGGSSFRLL
jgi:hypothetical protein